MSLDKALYEKLGAFYLGREVDPESGDTAAEPLLYDSRDLVTHGVCIGMTGSGKTGLCISLIEEAALDGVPALILDVKGDLGNLLLLIVAASFLLLDRRWFAAVILLAWGSWVALVWILPPSPQWTHYGFALLSGTALSLLIHGLHVRQLRTLEILHLRDRRRQTELEMAVSAAVAANRSKSEFLTTMSHELRTPLNSIIGFANVLLRNRHGLLASKELSFLGRILDNGKHLLALIEQVLDLSRLEAGRLHLDVSQVALGELLSEVVGELRPVAAAKGLGLRLEVPPRVEPLTTDRRRLKQVLLQLIENGLKFTEEGGVTLWLVTDEVSSRPSALAVVDTGIGISDERLAAMFEPFEQGESGFSRRYQGSGLGLAISRFLCDLLGYGLEVTSEPGEGSTFTVLFRAVGSDDTTAARMVH